MLESQIESEIFYGLMAAGGSAPPSTDFAYTPDSATINWVDTNGAHSGNLASFNAMADKANVTAIEFPDHGGELATLSNLQDLPMLATITATDTILQAVDTSGLIHLTALDVSVGNVSSLNVTGCVALATLNCSSNSISAITGLATCTALTDFNASSNQFATLNLNFMPAHIIALDVSNNPLVTLTDDNLVDTQLNLTFGSINVAHISFPALLHVGLAGGGFDGSNNTALLTCSVPVLIDVDHNSFSSGVFNMSACPAMTTLTQTAYVGALGTGYTVGGCSSLSALTFPAGFMCDGEFTLQNCAALATVTFGAGASFGANINADNCGLLSTLNLSTATFADNGQTITFGSCALAVGDATHGADGVLARAVASGCTGVTIVLTGTNMPDLDASGLANAAILTLAGCSVTANNYP